jgi:sphingolipid delta-4 desaturase
VTEPASVFRISGGEDPHRARRRAILAAHPEIAALATPFPASLLVILGLVGFQLVLAWALREASVLVIVATAYGIGAFAAAGLHSMIHDASHGRVVVARNGNRLAAILANLPLLSVAAMPFFYYHPWHHGAMGDYAMDVGIPTEAEARWVEGRPFRKALWLALFPVVQLLRTRKFRPRTSPWDRWAVLNAAVQLAADALLLWAWGWHAPAYLGLSYWLSVGLHPAGTRVIQEHFFVQDGQETHSYVGPCNLVEMNFGYHVEHHDFPRVPWYRLPRLRRIAPEFYETVHTYHSRLRLLVEFLVRSEWQLTRHTIRRRAHASVRHCR